MSVYTENQIHARVYAGTAAGQQITRLVQKATETGLLSGIDEYGDTMFNVTQLYRLDNEIRSIGRRWPDLAADVEAFSALIQRIIRDRGYLWLAGD